MLQVAEAWSLVSAGCRSLDGLAQGTWCRKGHVWASESEEEGDLFLQVAEAAVGGL